MKQFAAPSNIAGAELSTEPILLTDFDVNNLRVVEVIPSEWNNVETWSANERPMTGVEFAAINTYIHDTHGFMALGKALMQEQGRPIRVRGYVYRPIKKAVVGMRPLILMRSADR